MSEALGGHGCPQLMEEREGPKAGCRADISFIDFKRLNNFENMS